MAPLPEEEALLAINNRDADEAISLTQPIRNESFCAMDLSADDNTLAVSSHAGFVCLVELDVGRPAWRIGAGEHHERQRWRFWKGQNKPLLW